VWAAARWNKPRAYQAGLSFLTVVLIGLSFMPTGQPALVFTIAGLT
jgi:hypothetical protein